MPQAAFEVNLSGFFTRSVWLRVIPFQHPTQLLRHTEYCQVPLLA